MSQIVHVVSMLEVMMRLGETTFQSKEVIGAVCSGDLEFERRARGDSFWRGASLGLVERLIEFDRWDCGSDGRDHNLRWSPDVARRSVVDLFDDGGSHNILVTGYECVASAVLMNSNPPSPWGSSGSGCTRCASIIWIYQELVSRIDFPQDLLT
jgi:hypothetical protein